MTAGGGGLLRLFEPRSIAVVGASVHPEKRGHQILRALDRSGYAGRVFPVNRGGGRIVGRRAVRSVTDLPEGVDLAVLSVPAAAAPALVRDCGARGVGAAIVLAVGFRESGAAGSRLEARLRRAGREAGVRILGPNTSGLLNLSRGINLIGAPGVRAGGVALVVQSGNIALGLMDELVRGSGLGISICCGLGNECDVGFAEVLDYLGGHAGTTAIVMHFEGCCDARRLLEVGARVSRAKPVLALKSGRTAEGARTALSHTGAVAGPYDRLRAGFRQAGIVEVTRTDELVPVAAALASQPPGPPPTGVGVLSDGGGQSTLVSDALNELGAPTARLREETSTALRKRLGPAAAVKTPVDVAGAADADPGVFLPALELLAGDPGVGTVLLVGMFGGYAIRFSETLAASEVAAARGMAAVMRAAGKGFVVHSQYAGHGSEALLALAAAGVPVIGSLEAACRAAAELQSRGSVLAGPVRWPGPRPRRGPPGPGGGREVIEAARREARVGLDEQEARTLLGSVDLRFPPLEVVGSAGAAAAAAARAGRPVAIRLLSRTILHKSDAGGVELGVSGGNAASAAFERIAAAARSWAAVRGLPPEAPAATVTPMLAAPVAELLVGAFRDPQLGPVITLGAGGTLVEALSDVVHRVVPASAEELDAALGELAVDALLRGHRGRPAGRRSAVVKAAAAVAECLLRWPEVAEAEVNPLFVYAHGVVPVDARVVLTPDSRRPTPT